MVFKGQEALEPLPSQYTGFRAFGERKWDLGARGAKAGRPGGTMTHPFADILDRVEP